MAATVSVVQFSSSNSPHKVLQQSTNTNNNNFNNDQRREIIILRKPPISGPNKDFSKEDILITNTARKKVSQKCSKDSIHATKPAPVAVARRNARERNRVKQVNNGFANLRQRIPNSIAAAFESSNGRGGSKKLSKVETLRMAVEYIRRLEDILASESGELDANYPSLSDSPALGNSNSNLSYSYPMLSPSADEDDLSSTNPTPPPQQYIKIQVNDGYQLLPVHIYEDSENLDPIDENLLTDPSLLSSDLEFSGVQDLNFINTNASLSPEMYSDHSLSPNSLDKTHESLNQSYHTHIPVFNTRHIMSSSPLVHPDATMKFRLIPPGVDVKPEPHILSMPEGAEIQYRLSPPIQQIKTEVQDMVAVPMDQMVLDEHKPNVLDVMTWWEQQHNLQLSQQNTAS